MGRKADQNYSGETYRPADLRQSSSASPARSSNPPPLPPRSENHCPPSSLDDQLEAPPPYTEIAPTYHSQSLSRSWSSQDPRSSSSQSLVPRQSIERNDKRTLLLIYVHGFMGNETSFQSFPAHVHNVLTLSLAKSHAVHTKIYPKYKSRKRIEFARDALSQWLRPHEGTETDVILLGHSMGGILLSEVILNGKHRILGTINFDTPFLGMHPGVIASGLGSLFRPAPESPAPQPTEARVNNQDVSSLGCNTPIYSSTAPSYFAPEAGSRSGFGAEETDSTTTPTILSSSSTDRPVHDPTYDPPFTNDVRLPQRKGWANAMHFVSKHSDGLIKASQTYVQSHLEFGGAMADYNGLKRRYEKVRGLESGRTPEGAHVTRVRFVNYYTASTGRPKKLKEPKSAAGSEIQMDEENANASGAEDGAQSVSLGGHGNPSPPASSHILVENADDEKSFMQDPLCTNEDIPGNVKSDVINEDSASDASQAMNRVSPTPIMGDALNEDHEDFEDSVATSNLDPSLSIDPNSRPPSQEAPNLPPIPAAPDEPGVFDASLYPDKDTRKLAEKDHARLVKAYKQAVKHRDKAISDRRKFLEKREKERTKQVSAEQKDRRKPEQRGKEKGERERAKIEKEEAKRLEKEKAKAEIKAAKQATKESNTVKTTSNTNATSTETKDENPKRDKVFCMLPPKINGQIDPCWVRVFMPDMDEVGAHCGLFFVDGERYRNFVTDVATRIESWIIDGGTMG